MSASQITVVGAGLVGLASAWALQKQGFAVRVIEAREHVALETSFANAGMLTPSMADPWNAPGIWLQLLRWLGHEEAPMLIRPSALPQYLRWGLRFLRHSSPARHRAATAANFDLAMLSLREFQSLRQNLAIDYDLRTAGTVQVFRQQGSFATAQGHADFLRTHGLAVNVMNGAGLAELEPLLAPVCSQFVGGLHFPDDETGDAHRFCQGLAAHLVQQGVEFSFGESLQSIRVERNRLVGLQTSKGDYAVDQLVLAAAARSPALLAAHGINLAIQPVKGYSLTIPVDTPSWLPGLSIVDHHLHAALTPLDARIRLAGTAEFSGWDERIRPQRIENLWGMLQRILPEQYPQHRLAEAESWCGFRPMSADGLPYIGPSAVKGLYVNAGQGHLGWTQSLGSGRLLAAMIAGDKAPIDPNPFRLSR